MNDKTVAGAMVGVIAGLIVGIALDPILKMNGLAPWIFLAVGLVVGAGAGLMKSGGSTTAP